MEIEEEEDDGLEVTTSDLIQWIKKFTALPGNQSQLIKPELQPMQCLPFQGLATCRRGLSSSRFKCLHGLLAGLDFPPPEQGHYRHV